jgi:hypothetical protein
MSLIYRHVIYAIVDFFKIFIFRTKAFVVLVLKFPIDCKCLIETHNVKFITVFKEIAKMNIEDLIVIFYISL